MALPTHPSPRQDGAPATPAPGARPATSTGGVRVLQNRRAPAQLSLFARALPVR